MTPIWRWFGWLRKVAPGWKTGQTAGAPPVPSPVVVTPALPVIDSEGEPEFPAPGPEEATELPLNQVREPAVEPELPPTATPQPAESPVVQPLPAVPDAEEIKARAMARMSYFAPAGYSPFHAPPPKLLVSSRHASAGGPTVAGTAGPRSYFSAVPAALSARAPAPPPGVLSAIDPAVLALYLLGREDDRRLDPAWSDLCLREPEMLSRAIRLRNDAIDNWLAARAPWNLAEFYARARVLAGHAGTALLICHNVARAFARGGTAIRWIKTDRNQGEYFDGARTFTARILNPRGVLRAGPFAEPSVFHLLFSAPVFGTVDSGDWHRYFGSAALAWYIAANAVTVAPPLAGFVAQWATLIDSAAQQLSAAPAGAARAWSYANAAGFVELSRFGRSADANRRTAHVQLAGTLFGLAEAPCAPPAGALWRIPAPTDAVRMDVAATTVESLDASGNAAGAAPAPIAALPTAQPIRDSVLQSLLHALPPGANAAPSAQIICTIEEGIGCRFAASGWHDPALQPMAETVIDELGWNALEHAVRRQAAWRVAPPAASGQPCLCELDLGEGYRACRVLTGV